MMKINALYIVLTNVVTVYKMILKLALKDVLLIPEITQITVLVNLGIMK